MIKEFWKARETKPKENEYASNGSKKHVDFSAMKNNTISHPICD